METLLQLLEAISPSGHEETTTCVFRHLVLPNVDEVVEDALGNLVAVKKGIGDGKLMLVSHADEVGLLISYISEQGYLHFKPIGAIDVSILPGLRVQIAGKQGTVIGVIGKKPIHLQGQDAGGKLSWEELWIDIGAGNKTEALERVELGSPATFLSPLEHLSETVITSKALDDRIGLYILLKAAERLKDVETPKSIYFVASTQEEIGFRGAEVAAKAIGPDESIAIDVTHAADYPGCSPIKDGEIKMGAGAVLTVSPNVHKDFYKKLKAIAENDAIAIQTEVGPYPSGTDARVIQLQGVGVKTALVSIPCRYMHTPNEMVSMKDVEACIELIVRYCME